MFLISITKNKVVDKIRSVNVNVNELDINTSIITIVTDNYLSRYLPNLNGFALIESICMSADTIDNSRILTEIKYIKDADRLQIVKPTISGRPIYYHINRQGEFYCSTSIAMLRKVGVVIEENRDVLPEYFVYRFIMPPRTLYKNINQLLAGSSINVKLTNNHCVIESVDNYNPFKEVKSNALDNLNEINKDALNYLMESIGNLSPCKDKLLILLSGGLDSSILFKLCQQKYLINDTYSTGYPFEDKNNNIEKEYSISAAKAFKTNHTYYEVTNNDYLEGIIRAISVAEEPLHHLQSVMFYLMFSMGLPKHKNIVVSGQGADGVFGLSIHNKLYNYNRKKTYYNLFSKYPIITILQMLSGITGKGQTLISSIVSDDIGPAIAIPISDPNHIIWSLGNYGSEEWVCNQFNVKNIDIIKNRYDYIKRYNEKSIYDILSILDFIGDVSISQSIWAKLGEDNRKILYYPFNDSKLLDYIYSLSWDIKLRYPKYILRSIAQTLKIPKFIIKRKKGSFGVMPQRWAKREGAFEPLVAIASKEIDKNDILSMQDIDYKKAMTFWNMLNYAIWKRLCINNEPLSNLLDELHCK